MTGTPEYQYHLNDHLGNIRVTVTAKPPVADSYTTDFEAGSNSNFNNYSIHNFDLVDHTDATGTTYTKTQLLNGSGNNRVGLAKAFSVMPGDVITAGAWVKYMNLSGTSNPNTFINSLAAAFGVSSGSIGEAGKIFSGLNTFAGTVVAGDHTGDDEGAPKAFATILLFDKDYNLVDAAWDQVTTVGAQTSPSTKQPPHDLVQATLTARSGGYAYVFLSNEHPTLVDVYFDDASFSLTPTPVVQTQDYYPFGLSFNSYKRQASVPNQFQYNGKELQEELSLGWLDYGARMYMPEIGRWGSVDPAAEFYVDLAPYNYVRNDPILLFDLNGMYDQALQDQWQKENLEENGFNVAAVQGPGRGNTKIDNEGNIVHEADIEQTFTASDHVLSETQAVYNIDITPNFNGCGTGTEADALQIRSYDAKFTLREFSISTWTNSSGASLGVIGTTIVSNQSIEFRTNGMPILGNDPAAIEKFAPKPGVITGEILTKRAVGMVTVNREPHEGWSVQATRTMQIGRRTVNAANFATLKQSVIDFNNHINSIPKRTFRALWNIFSLPERKSNSKYGTNTHR